jgi:hypothetical protein
MLTAGHESDDVLCGADKIADFLGELLGRRISPKYRAGVGTRAADPRLGVGKFQVSRRSTLKRLLQMIETTATDSVEGAYDPPHHLALADDTRTDRPRPADAGPRGDAEAGGRLRHQRSRA